MNIISMQFAFFTNNYISRPDLLKEEINNKVGNKFDGMPTILNLPENAPAEIPIVQVQSLDKILALNISRNRIDFFVSPNLDMDMEPLDIYNKYFELIKEICDVISVSSEVNRMGIIFTLFEASEHNVEYIFNKYLKELYMSTIVETSIRTNYQSLHKGIEYNNVRTIEASNLSHNNQIYKGILIQLDINNIPNKTVILNFDKMESMLKYASNKIQFINVKEWY